MNDELKHEYEKIMMDNNIPPYSEAQMKITEFVNKLISKLGKWEVVASGNLGLGVSNYEQWGVSFINDTQLAERLENHEGKNIEIAVREVK